MSDSVSLKPHRLLSQLIADDGARAAPIRGYVGPSSEGTLRLYRDLRTRRFVDIPEAAVLAIEGDSEKGPVTAWGDACADLKCVETVVRCCKAGEHDREQDSAEKGLSEESCRRLDELIDRVGKVIADISTGQTPIDPDSAFGRDLLRELEGLDKELRDLRSEYCEEPILWP